MLFNSFTFVIFFLGVLTVFNLFPSRWRLYWLLLASYFFYSWWNPFFLPLLLSSTLFNYVLSKQLVKVTKVRKKLLFIGISANLLLLLYFKYRNFFLDLTDPPPSTTLVIPLGISFICLQGISYLIDVYNRTVIPPKPLFFALYKSFFPQLLAGPIERAGILIPQFSFNKPTNYLQMAQGTKLVMWGYFKKILIADKLALIIDPIYSTPQLFHSEMLLGATLLFSWQIYCDFSGYTDIATGVAIMFGIKLSSNFNKPFEAASLHSFWQRWHQTLHYWFKDYVYIPLKQYAPHSIQVLSVFLLSGLWHGSNLTFIIWGLFHGILYLLTYQYIKLPIQLPHIIKIMLTFTAVTLGWVFFRASTLSQSFYILSSIGSVSIFSIPEGIMEGLQQLYQQTIITPASLAIIFVLLMFFLFIEYSGIIDYFLKSPNGSSISISRLVLIDILFILLILFGDWGGSSFIYFQF